MYTRKILAAIILAAILATITAYYTLVHGGRQPVETPTASRTLATPETQTTQTPTPTTTQSTPQPGTVKLVAATTTSLYQTGLLEALANEFRKSHPNVEIQFLPKGTGEALRIAASGDACMVLVHAPSVEQKYIDNGVIEYHRIIAYNYFIVVGPSSDPAGVKGSQSVLEAFKKIYAAGEEGRALFVSRGDKSGTHVKELELWNKTGLDPRGKPWYIEAGQGMGQVLVMSEEKKAYTLSDISTYLKYKKDGKIPSLEIVYGGDENLINIYSAYLVASCKGAERQAAKEFIDFMASPQGQEFIKNFGVAEYGGSLFNPAIDKLAELTETWNRLAKGG